jgi:hypothetical protein
MDAKSRVIEGELVTTRLAGRMEDTLQAFALRAACFTGEPHLSFSEEFDGEDFNAAHRLAYLGEEPIGILRMRRFQSFAMPARPFEKQGWRSGNAPPELETIGALRCRPSTAVAPRPCRRLPAGLAGPKSHATQSSTPDCSDPSGMTRKNGKLCARSKPLA